MGDERDARSCGVAAKARNQVAELVGSHSDFCSLRFAAYGKFAAYGVGDRALVIGHGGEGAKPGQGLEGVRVSGVGGVGHGPTLATPASLRNRASGAGPDRRLRSQTTLAAAFSFPI
jgi:hypothetical protein